MKNLITALFVILGITLVFGQENDNPEFTGENFSLEGALVLFKKANSLEEFEKMLNQEDNNVNNLDLNDDGQTDYINVDAIKENDTHAIVLSIYLNANEKQDIATIGIEKTGSEEAVLQIMGDEELYAENTIVEPTEIVEKLDKNGKGPNPAIITNSRIFVNVWFWPSVRFIYSPSYTVWVSPYRWSVYPRWWKPWKRYRHAFFYTRCAPHRVYYNRTTIYRVTVAKKMYAPRRHSSTLVIKRGRNATIVHKNRKGNAKIVKVSKKRRRR
jgi:hypothetical protein